MASPQTENGYTKIANELLDALCVLQLSGQEWSVVHAIIRKTYGFNKKEDWITGTQIATITGLHRVRVSEAKNKLLAKNIVTENRNKISLNKDFETWGIVTENRNSVTENRNKLLRKTVHTKDNKDNIQKSKKNNMPIKKYNENQHHDDGLEEIQTDPDFKPEMKTKKRASDDVQAVYELFDNPAKKIWHLREIERESAKALLEAYGLETLKKRIKRIQIERKKKDPYFPEANTPSQLLDKMPNIERYLGI